MPVVVMRKQVSGFGRLGCSSCLTSILYLVCIDNYPTGTTINFLSFPNVHAIASAHAALLRSAATVTSLRNWCYAPDAIAWLQHSTDLLEAAGGSESVVSKIVNDDACVLIVSDINS